MEAATQFAKFTAVGDVPLSSCLYGTPQHRPQSTPLETKNTRQHHDLNASTSSCETSAESLTAGISVLNRANSWGKGRQRPRRLARSRHNTPPGSRVSIYWSVGLVGGTSVPVPFVLSIREQVPKIETVDTCSLGSTEEARWRPCVVATFSRISAANPNQTR